MTLKPNLDKFALEIIEESMKKGEKPVPFQEKLDAFKAVAAYYAILAKHKADPPAADEGATFDAFRATLHEESNGGSTTALQRSRRRGSIGGPDPRPIGGN